MVNLIHRNINPGEKGRVPQSFKLSEATNRDTSNPAALLCRLVSLHISGHLQIINNFNN